MDFLSKKWVTFWKPSLGRKLSVYFTLFGFIIGCASIALLTMINIKNYVDFAMFTAEKRFPVLIQIHEGTRISDFTEAQKAELSSATSFLCSFSNDYYAISNFKLFYYDNAESSWSEVVMSENNSFRLRPLPAVEAAKFKDSKNETIEPSGLMTINNESFILLDINLTKFLARNKYVIKVVINQRIITAFIHHRILDVLLIFGLLTLVSHFLGHFFAWRIIRPIKKISEGSAQIAGGNFSYRFNIKNRDELGVLANSLNVMASKTEAYISEIEWRMNAMGTMNRIDKAVLSSTSRNDLLDRVISIVSEFHANYSIGIALRDEEKKGFDLISFYVQGTHPILGDKPFIPDSELDPSLLAQMTQIVDKVIPQSQEYSPLAYQIVGEGARSLLSIPINMMGDFIGVLIIAKLDDQSCTGEEKETMKMIADQVGVAIQSVRLNEDKENLFLGILLALTRSIDAKSRWTSGHSERVAKFAEAIGIKLAMDEGELRILTISAILHDIGKIAVPELILDKPDRLSDAEFSVIQTHPEVGARIIADIPSYGDIQPGILYHHERFDGSGYPKHLAGKDIPLFGRIIAVADVYDALTDDRPYRKGWDTAAAMRFLDEQKGKMFDPVIVDIFLTSLNEKGFFAG